MSKLDFTQVELQKIITHHIGNKLRDEKFQLSNEESIIAAESRNFLLKYFLSTANSEELYGFCHAVEIKMNAVYAIVREIFSEPESFIRNSQNIAKLLYENSMHPKIQEGQLNVAYFSKIGLDGGSVDAIGMFKSEIDSPFIQMKKHGSRFSINHDFGFDLKDMDKGCLVFNTDSELGFKVLIIDRFSKSSEAQYWKNDFLNIKPLNTDFHQTNQFLNITRKFVTNQLPEDFEVTKADQIDFLNRSVDYFKNHEKFDKQEFEEEVFAANSLVESFRKFDQTYRGENDVDFSDNFEISTQAVKKQARVFKSVLKLDKNFHIYIHGNKELIEQGVDKDGRKYYKIYFEEES